MRSCSSAARIYLAAAVVVLPVPYVMPLADLMPAPPDRMIVWPNVAFGSAPVAVIAVLVGILHKVFRLTARVHRNIALVWAPAAVLTIMPLPLWFPRGPVGYFIAVGLQSFAASVAVLALLWLAHGLWLRRQPARWFAVVAIVQVALIFLVISCQFAAQILVRDWVTLNELIEGHIAFTAHCAFAAGVLSAAIVAGWWRGIVER